MIVWAKIKIILVYKIVWKISPFIEIMANSLNFILIISDSSAE